MHIYIIFAHPSRTSFTFEILDSFTSGLNEAGHTYEIGDLYAMGFQPVLDPTQFSRETALNDEVPVPDDVREEQKKVEKADALVFIYPVWWSDCPAILKGWFDRVWSYGYAYYYEDGEHIISNIEVEKALVICPAGDTVEHLEEVGIAESMRRIMLNDRLKNVGVKQTRMEIMGGVVGFDEKVRNGHLETVFRLGLEF